MEKRTFLLSCAAFAAALSMDGVWRTLRAAAGQTPGSDAERILRLTRGYAATFPLLSAKEVLTIIQQNKRRHLFISLQSREEYTAGHVPGSMLFPPEALADPEMLQAFVHKLPENKTVVLICPNGHLSCAVMLFLRQLGREASTLALGMDGWNRAHAGSGAYSGDISGEVSTTPTRLEPAHTLDESMRSGLDDETLLIQKSHRRFLEEVAPSTLRGKPEKMVLCLRRPEDYAAGHIPGSVNIPGEAFLSGDKIITQIPRNREILLSCYVGHYSSAAALLLTQLGYDAYSVAWGMAGWNNKYIGPISQVLSHSSNFPVESGTGAIYMDS